MAINEEDMVPREWLPCDERTPVTEEPAKPVCEHVPGKYLGIIQSIRFASYKCAKCGEEFKLEILNK